ncbi:DUF6461 domain-containing protein [Streptacidiphilus sp. MAP12-33]|uniref:DUF6461 domain-containing protein n=1 Tax=Streptacidiphilus sp. MAP12-33 TaxID=3156266 RepID=UPI003518F100
MDEITAVEERFAWMDDLEEDYILPAIAVVAGVPQDEVIRRLHGDLGAGRRLTAKQAADETVHVGRSEDLVGVGTVGDLVFVVEASGYTTAIPGVLRDLSRGGRCFSVQIDINGGDSVHYAVDGELVVFEEHWGPISPLRAGDPRWETEWCRGLIDVEDETEIWGMKIFALMERVMGATVHPSWFTEPLDTYAVPLASGYARTPAWAVPCKDRARCLPDPDLSLH